MRRGFTLVELVVVMALLGLSLVGVSRLLSDVSGVYLFSQSRADLLAQSRFALERISRELRQATPNSVRVSNAANYSCLEFVPFSVAGRYRQITLAPQTSSNMDVVSLKASWPVASGQWLLVYPQSAADVYQQQNQRVQLAATPTVDDSDGLAYTARLQLSSPFGFATGSPAKRFYLLQSPVSFCATAGGLYRYDNYGWLFDQPVPGAGLASGAPLLTNLSNNLTSLPVFSVASPALTRNSLVQFDLELTSNTEADVTLSYSHLIQVNNVP